MTQFWTITNRTGGAVIDPCFATQSAGSHPKDNGLVGWNSTTMTAVRIPQPPDPILQIFDGTKWVADPARVEAALIEQVKTSAEMEKMKYLTPGGAKKEEYAAQAAEVRFFNSLGGTVQVIVGVLNLWPPERKAIIFPCAAANAAEFGDTIDKAIARFTVGMMKSSVKDRIAAREAKVCDTIRKTASVAGKVAAAAVTWPTS